MVPLWYVWLSCCHFLLICILTCACVVSNVVMPVFRTFASSRQPCALWLLHIAIRLTQNIDPTTAKMEYTLSNYYVDTMPDLYSHQVHFTGLNSAASLHSSCLSYIRTPDMIRNLVHFTKGIANEYLELEEICSLLPSLKYTLFFPRKELKDWIEVKKSIGQLIVRQRLWEDNPSLDKSQCHSSPRKGKKRCSSYKSLDQRAFCIRLNKVLSSTTSMKEAQDTYPLQPVILPFRSVRHNQEKNINLTSLRHMVVPALPIKKIIWNKYRHANR